MKFARFLADGTEHYGIVDNDRVVAIKGDLFSNYTRTDTFYSLKDVRLLAPVKPSKIIGVGLNYKSAAAARGAEFPAAPLLFLKPPSGLIGPDEDIVVPASVKQPVFEVELAAVIGKRCKNVSEATALDVIFGYTLCNDVTAKDHMAPGQPWGRSKSFDTFTPVGPYIVTGLDPENTELILTVNGVEKQRGSTSDMIFGVKSLIAFISGIMTLEPGDLIITGTPAGGDEFKRGDTLELSSSCIGLLRNKVV